MFSKVSKQNKILLGPAALGSLLLALCFWPYAVFAQSSTPSASPTTDPSIQEKVEERLQKVLNEKTDKKRAFFGEIRNIGGTIELKTNTETKHLLPSETDLEIVGANRESLEIQDLEIGGFVIAMGYLTDEGTLDTRRLVISKKTEPDTREVIFGTITDITNDGENIVTVTALNGDDESIYEVETGSKTDFLLRTGEDSEEIDFDKLKTDQKVIIIGTASAKNNKLIAASSIHVVIGSQSAPATSSPAPSPATNLTN